MSASDPENPVTPPATDAAPAAPTADQAGNPTSPIREDQTAQAADAGEQTIESAPTIASVPLELPDFSPRTAPIRNDQAIDLLSDVELDVKIELGRANMLIEDVLRLGQGSVVELDKLAGDPVDVLVNDRLVARGEVLVLNDNFCVRISEIVAGAEEEVVKAGAA
jgi:flagellar motor switch protein FliN/FliY